jgi:hypothetical protein
MKRAGLWLMAIALLTTTGLLTACSASARVDPSVAIVGKWTANYGNGTNVIDTFTPEGAYEARSTLSTLRGTYVLTTQSGTPMILFTHLTAGGMSGNPSDFTEPYRFDNQGNLVLGGMTYTKQK